MRCWKKRLLDTLLFVLAALVVGTSTSVVAQEPVSNGAQIKLEKIDAGLWLSAQVDFELPHVVEDALLKGVPVFFVAQVAVLRERWYWKDQRIAAVRRQFRLSFHPLTQRWRLNISHGDVQDAAPGLVLNQNFDTLSEALGPVKRIFRWRVADMSDLDPGATHRLEFSFALDLTQLPRPLHIGTFGQSDWTISRLVSIQLEPEPSK
jgi:hypothetical protein